MDDILVLAVFGISALLVPVWLLLEWRRRVRERARLNEELFKSEVGRGARMSDGDEERDGRDLPRREYDSPARTPEDEARNNGGEG